MFFVNSDDSNTLKIKLFINNISYKTGYSHSAGTTQMSFDFARFSEQFSLDN